MSLIDDMETSVAKQMNLSLKHYRNYTQHDWWLNSSRAMQFNAADAIVSVQCSSELLALQNTQVIRSLFGNTEITWSKCPLITYPISINGNSALFTDNIDINSDTWSSTIIKKINMSSLSK